MNPNIIGQKVFQSPLLDWINLRQLDFIQFSALARHRTNIQSARYCLRDMSVLMTLKSVSQLLEICAEWWGDFMVILDYEKLLLADF